MGAMDTRGQTFVQRLSCVPESNGGLTAFRRAALEWVSEHGFPTTRDEAWKYTQVSPILDIPFTPAQQGMDLGLSPGWIDQHAGRLGGVRLVFINGFFAKGLSSFEDIPQGAKITNLASVEGSFSQSLKDQPNAFTALNTALARDGAFIQIPKNVVLETPIHLVFVSGTESEPTMSHPRSLVVAEAGSTATVVETHLGAATGTGRYLSNAVMDVALGEGAVVTHIYVQNEAETAFHLSHLGIRPGAGSRVTTHSVALGGRIARQEVKVMFNAPGAQAVLNGLYMPMNKQHIDNPTAIEHIAPQCESRTLYKGVIGGQGVGIFDGRVVVHPGAIGTDSSQANKNLLLSDTAQANTRPRLEILADDVKCAHGATVGQLDDQAIFYLRSRGVPVQVARDILTLAFADEMLNLIPMTALRSHVRERAMLRMRAEAQEVIG